MAKQTFPSDKDDRLLRLVEVARWLNVSESTIYKWLRANKFPQPITLGDEGEKTSAIRFHKSEIDDWLSARPRGKILESSLTAAGPTGLRKNAHADRNGASET